MWRRFCGRLTSSTQGVSGVTRLVATTFGGASRPSSRKISLVNGAGSVSTESTYFVFMRSRNLASASSNE